MTTTSTLLSTLRTASPFKAFTSAANPSLTSRVHVLFGMTVTVAYFAAGSAYCLYNFYQAYQLHSHTSFGLGDNFKIVKCKALLLEASEKMEAEDASPLLQQCEALLATIKDSLHSHDKESLLLKLAKHYAKTNPDQTYAIAQQLTTSSNLFNAAQSIQKAHPELKSQIIDLYMRAYQAELQEWKHPEHRHSIMDIEWCLKIAKASYDLNEENFACTIVENMMHMAESFKLPLDRISAYCKIAECAHETALKFRKGCIGGARDVLKGIPKETPEELVIVLQSRLILAKTFFSIEEFARMEKELREILKLFESNPSTIHKDLLTFVMLIGKINSVVSDFESFPVQLLFEKARNCINSLDAKMQAESYLNLASLHQEEFVDYPEGKDLAYDKITRLPENSEAEIKSKIDLLIRLISFFKTDLSVAHVIIHVLEKLYDRCPLKTDFPENWNKHLLGEKIIMLYHDMGLAAESEDFYQKHSSDCLEQEETEPFNKINRLAHSVSDLPGYEKYDSAENKKAKLEAAERLFPLLKYSSQRSIAAANIAEGYLRVNRQRSLAILADWEISQARSYMITGAVTAVFMGVLHFYPQVSPVLSLGLTVLRLF